MEKETKITRANEKRLVDTVAEKLNLKVVMAPYLYPVDAILLRGRTPVCFVEARKRNVSKDKYRTFIWSLQKYINVCRYAWMLPTILVIEWDEGMFALKMEGKKYPVVYIDRTGTTARDNSDNEPCIEVPIDEFIPIDKVCEL